ncbi:MAG: putative chromosome segregation ATPase [Ramlibacter sp.]|nr:putative chromosome segregation ATPase [Ramlibacter sp.]
MSPRLFHFFLFRLLPVLLLGLVGARAIAQTDPPGRVGRLNYAEGPVVFSPTGDNEWTDAALNRPLTRGDRLWTDKGSRAEIQVGSSAVRMDGLTHVEILALDDQSSQLSVTQGTVYVRVRSLPEGENFEIDTPNLAYRAAYPGDYRIDVDAARGTTRVTIHSGTGAVYGEGGQVLPLGGGQQITFRTRVLAQVGAQESPPQDNFDRWAAERNRREDQSISARYVPREVVGYQQLDAHGQWMQDATHGTVWFPRSTPADWAPYRNGHWEWISPWGWSWIDDAPWGFAPFHYGRWAMIGSRWAWVPGRIGLKPVYAPALVAFVGGSTGGSWSLPIGTGRPGVAWFPLAPGEAWQPAYQASPVYISNVNRNLTLQANATYAHQHKPDALTAISAEDFHRGKPARAGWLRIAANTLTNAQIVPPPPMPERAVTDHQLATASRITPPAQAQARQAIADAAATRQAEAAQRQAQVQAAAQAQPQAKAAQAAAQQQADARREQLAKAAAQPKQPAEAVALAPAAKAVTQPVVAAPQAKPADQARTAEQAKAVEQARRVEQARHAEQAKAAEQARRAEQAKAAEQTRRAEQAKASEQARREKLAARAEQSKREQLAKRAEQMQREQAAKRAEQAKREQLAKREQARREQVAKRAEQQQARRAEQAKREAVARHDELQRREAHAQQVEKARRAADQDAQVLAEQRAKREAQQAKRDAQEREQAQREVAQREQAQREASARQQQALAEQWRRDRQALEQQQRVRQRPDLRDDRRSRGIPILNSAPLS